MSRWVGIDLGTTNSVVAVVEGGQPRVLDNRENKPLTRSVVSLRSKRGHQEIVVGEDALENWPMAPADTIVSVKRLMGRGLADPDVHRIRRWAAYSIVEPEGGTSDSLRVLFGGEPYSPIDISAMILRKVKADAEYRLGAAVSHAVVTVPAYFSQIQRDATRQACRDAGMKVMKIVDEPTAAAIAAGLDVDDGSEPKTLVVFDLGGGTFDVSVLMSSRGLSAPLNLEGDMWLGGDDFDQIIVEEAVRHIREEYGIDPTPMIRFMVALRRAAQGVKERLGAARSADLIVPGLLQDQGGNLIDVDIEITRSWYEVQITPLIERAVGLVEKALGEMPLADVDHVVMAGGSSSMPWVQRAMEEFFGKEKLLRRMNPKHCVAMGAALLAARLGGVVCQAPNSALPGKECGQVNELTAGTCTQCGADLEGRNGEDVIIGTRSGVELPPGIAPFPYGIQSAGDQFTIFVEKSEPYPTQDVTAHDFFTRMPNQRMISLPIFGGEHRERASDNERQGEAFAVLPLGLPKGTSIRVALWLDDDGVLKLAAHLADGADLHPWLVPRGETMDRTIKTLEEAEVALGAKLQSIPAAKMKGVDRQRERVFQAFREDKPETARAEVERLHELIGEADIKLAPSPVSRAKDMCFGTDRILHDYGWAISTYQLGAIQDQVRETRRAMSRSDEELEAAMGDLQRELKMLPPRVNEFLNIEGVIRYIGEIRPTDADRFRLEFEAAMVRIRADDPAGWTQLSALVDSLNAVTSGHDQRQALDAFRCTRGHEVPRGAHYCPKCREDMWGLDKKGVGPSPGDAPPY